MRLPFRLLGLVAALAALAPAGRAQQEGLLQIGDRLSEFLQRQEAAGRLPADAMVDFQPVSGYEANRLLDSLALDAQALSPVDRQLLARFRGEVPGPNVERLGRKIPGAYADGQTAYSARGDDYAIVGEPLLDTKIGPSRQTVPAGADADETPDLVYQASRGVRVAGHLGDHLFFESRIEENQRRPALYAWDADRRTAPRLGNVKSGGESYDYWRAAGVVGYRDTFVEARFGRDRNRWGPAQGSVFLSDYGPAYDQLQVRAHVGRFRYASLFSRYVTPEGAVGNTIFPSKFGATHQLGVSLPGRLDLDLFETVVFADDTTDGNRSGFELAYLNPIIFYRAVEADQSTRDNVMLGASLAWRPVGGVQTYGQLLLDELKFSELGNDWWGNKFGTVVGAHLVDVGLDGLDVRAEYARLRPYLYSHRSESTAFVHYSDPLGHPAGANASDAAVFVRYLPTATVEAALNVAYTQRGRNPDGVNIGADPRDSYETRESSRGVTFLQGVRQTQWLAEGRLSWELLPSLFAEGALVAQVIDDAERGRTRALSTLFGLRWGVPFQSQRY